MRSAFVKMSVVSSSWRSGLAARENHMNKGQEIKLISWIESIGLTKFLGLV